MKSRKNHAVLFLFILITFITFCDQPTDNDNNVNYVPTPTWGGGDSGGDSSGSYDYSINIGVFRSDNGTPISGAQLWVLGGPIASNYKYTGSDGTVIYTGSVDYEFNIFVSEVSAQGFNTPSMVNSSCYNEGPSGIHVSGSCRKINKDNPTTTISVNLIPQ